MIQNTSSELGLSYQRVRLPEGLATWVAPVGNYGLPVNPGDGIHTPVVTHQDLPNNKSI